MKIIVEYNENEKSIISNDELLQLKKDQQELQEKKKAEKDQIELQEILNLIFYNELCAKKTNLQEIFQTYRNSEWRKQAKIAQKCLKCKSINDFLENFGKITNEENEKENNDNE